jgi:hypothetical protein
VLAGSALIAALGCGAAQGRIVSFVDFDWARGKDHEMHILATVYSKREHLAQRNFDAWCALVPIFRIIDAQGPSLSYVGSEPSILYAMNSDERNDGTRVMTPATSAGISMWILCARRTSLRRWTRKGCFPVPTLSPSRTARCATVHLCLRAKRS